MSDFFESLNPQQKEGVVCTKGPVLVLAGAGSGKTKMLTARIAQLIGVEKVFPQNILAVTFTNKAAGEMRERVSRLLGLHEDALNPLPPYMMATAGFFSKPTIGTFHSVCLQILRREIDKTPYQQQFQIYDDGEQLSLIKECFQKLDISEKSFSPKSFQYGINQAKCAAQGPDELEGADFSPYTRNLKKVYSLYQTELYKANAIDFGEIIVMAYEVLKRNPEVLKKYQNLYQYIHVDEYQDTNRAQYLLVQLLASSHRNLCVVGDEDQSIYKWRGADIRNILDFEKDYPDAKIIKLEQNYRSTQTIINASSHVIANNSARKSKTLWTANDVGEKIQRYQLSDERAEAELVVSKVKELAREEFSFNDFAIFYRTNAQSRVFEDVFRREKIPYQIVGGLRFYDRKEIKDVLAYFRVLTNPSDGVSFKRIINVPQRGIGSTTVDKVVDYSTKNNLVFEIALREAVDLPDVVGTSPRKKIKEFLLLMDELKSLLSQKTLSEFYHELMDRTQYVYELKRENTEESLARIENLQEFDSTLAEFEENFLAANPSADLKADVLLPVFLETITLSNEQEDKQEYPAGRVGMMTLHTSKGLEFPVVFMVGMEEGLFPSIRPYEQETDEDIEEERRLCYVGMTRAKQKLFMTGVSCRRIYGNIVYNDPARFFNEVPEELVDYHDMTRRWAPTSAGDWMAQSSSRSDGFFNQSVEAPISNLGFSGSVQGGSGSISVGKSVRHHTYGIGVIRGVEGNNQDAKVVVEFNNKVVRKFVLKFANFEYL
ncbi:MAG: ATP-dependent helicase [Bacteriovoracia bacterium]